MFQFQDFMTGWSVAWAKVLFKETNESYGYIRLTKYLHAQGIEISQYAIRSIKKLTQLYCNESDS